MTKYEKMLSHIDSVIEKEKAMKNFYADFAIKIAKNFSEYIDAPEDTVKLIDFDPSFRDPDIDLKPTFIDPDEALCSVNEGARASSFLTFDTEYYCNFALVLLFEKYKLTIPITLSTTTPGVCVEVGRSQAVNLDYLIVSEPDEEVSELIVKYVNDSQKILLGRMMHWTDRNVTTLEPI